MKERVKIEFSSFFKAAAAPQSAPHALPSEASAVSNRSADKNIFDGRRLKNNVMGCQQSAVATGHIQPRLRPKMLSTTSYTLRKEESNRPD